MENNKNWRWTLNYVAGDWDPLYSTKENVNAVISHSATKNMDPFRNVTEYSLFQR